MRERATISPGVRRFVQWSTAIALVLAVVAVPLGRIALLGLPMLAVAVVAVPILRERNYQLIAPWSAVYAVVLVGGGVAALYMTLEWPDRDTVDTVYLLGRPDEYFLGPAFLMLAGLSALTVGYSIRSSGPLRRIPRALVEVQWDRQRYELAVAACVVLSLVGFAAYVQETGGLDLSRFSVKRVFALRPIGGEELGSFGLLRAVQDLGAVALLLVVGRFAYSGLRLSWRRWALLGALYLNAIVLDVYASTRADPFLLLGFGVAVWSVAGRRVSIRALTVFALGSLVMLQAMTYMRSTQLGELGRLTEAVDLARVGETVVLNNNVGLLPKTAHIVQAIPEQLDFAHGSTWLGYLAAPVPRALWADKPILGGGHTIGRTVFGTTLSGVPPGGIAEMYWNFGTPGVLLGCLLAGALLRRWYETVRRHLHRPGMALVYVVALLPLGFAILTIDVGAAVFLAAIRGVEMAVVAAFVAVRRSGGAVKPVVID